MQSTIESYIQKYSKGDSAYAQKLKTHIRDAMGYSNFMAKAKDQASGPADIGGDLDNLSPQGIINRMNSRFGIQNSQINSNLKIAGAMDSAAGSLASEQISAGKAAASRKANATGLENEVLFRPENDLESKLLEKLQNPYNVDENGKLGDKKSIQQIEGELREYAKSKLGPGEYVPGGPENEVNKMIKARVPEDYAGNEGKYYFMFKGYSEKTAEKNQAMIDYPTMDKGVQDAMRIKFPTLAKSFDGKDDIAEAIKTVTEKDIDGNIKYDFKEIADLYPDMTVKEYDEFIKPVYEKDAKESVDKLLMQQNKEGMTQLETMKGMTADAEKNKTKKEVIKGSLAFKTMLEALEDAYAGALKPDEITTMIFNRINNVDGFGQKPKEATITQGHSDGFWGKRNERMQNRKNLSAPAFGSDFGG